MARYGADSDGRRYAIVESGDCLSVICYNSFLRNGTPATYNRVAAINNISNPNVIHVGQKIYLEGSASGSSSSSSSTTNTNKAEITALGILSSEEKTAYATWKWDRHSDTEKYEYAWEYTIRDTGETWWSGSRGSTSNSDELESKYKIPDNAQYVLFWVKPISKTYTVEEGSGDKKKQVTKTYFTANWAASRWINVSKEVPPDAPGAPSVKLVEPDKNTLIAELNEIDHDKLKATTIEFQIVKNKTTQFGSIKSENVNTTYNYVKFTSGKLDPGAEYTVRCRSVRNGLRSDWSPNSNSVTTAPSKPAGFTECRAKSLSVDERVSIYFKWDAVASATSYDIQYATNIADFDTDAEKTLKDGITETFYETTQLETGYTYYFRFRAKNSGGESDWSEVSEATLGTVPEPPTTWSSTATAMVDGPLNLYWVHNSTDGSSQTFAQLELELHEVIGNNDNLVWSKQIEIQNSTDLDEKDKTSSFDATAYLQENTPNFYKEGVQLRWRVRTAGVTRAFCDDPDKNYGWSVWRIVDIYARPTVSLSVKGGTDGSVFETLTSFPIEISTMTAPKTQSPIGFYLSIVSNGSYDTVDNIGNDKSVRVGEQIYSKYFDQDTDLNKVLLSAGDVNLENGISYTLTCVASMNSGLTAEESIDFKVDWEEVSYSPNAIVQYDAELVTINIRPFCEVYTTTFKEVLYDSRTNTYVPTGNDIEVIEGLPLRAMYTSSGYRVYSEMTQLGETIYYYINGRGVQVTINESQIARSEYAITTTGESVYSGYTEATINPDGTSSGGEVVLYHQVQTGELVEDVLLSVYRREFDGTYTEIAKDIDNGMNTYVTDPHPALDYARYRIVATTKSTGAVSYYDMPSYPIMEKAVIIQWDEEWSNFDVVDNTTPAEPPWSGSMLRLPYNIDVSDNFGVDASLVAYAGRKRPVSYYGTQLGETSTWNTTIPKDDEETLYAIRRLAIWTGDCYVREPSGTGYWANVGVSFSQKHLDLTIPVTLNITRVEGGA